MLRRWWRDCARSDCRKSPLGRASDRIQTHPRRRPPVRNRIEPRCPRHPRPVKHFPRWRNQPPARFRQDCRVETEMFQTVGKPVLRKEARAKVTGTSKYVDDFSLPGMLHGVTVRSPVARGRIRNIDFPPGIPWDEFTIVTAADIPGENCVALIVDDQPYLAS